MPEMHEHPVPGESVHACGGGVSLADYPPPPASSGEILLGLLRSPNIAGRRWLRQQLGRQSVPAAAAPQGAGAGVLRGEADAANLVLCTVGNGARCSLSPYRGGKEAVAEAALAVSCAGATPAASTCFLAGWSRQGAAASSFEDIVSGAVEACTALGSPPVAGDALLAEEVLTEAGLPTLVVTMLGRLAGDVPTAGSYFQQEGDTVVLLGGAVPQIDGSEYQRRWFGRMEGIIPDVDLRLEAGLQRVVRQAAVSGVARSARSCGRGGLAVALADCCLGGLGVRLNLDRIPGAAPAYGGARTDVALFGEAATRAVLSVAPEHLEGLEGLCAGGEVSMTVLGRVGGDSLTYEIRGEQVGVAVAALQEACAVGSMKAEV